MPPAVNTQARGRTGGFGRGLFALALGICLAGTLAHADPKPGTAGLVAAPIEVAARRIDNFDRGSSRRQFGRLEFRGGLVLTSPSTNFGGWSGLEIDPDGKRILAISDAGAWMTGDLVYEGGRLAGLKHTRLGPITGLDGRKLPKERDRDAEGLRLLEGTFAKGTVLISFEQNHRIGRFEINERGLLAPSGYIKRPAEWSRMIRNKGIEAVAVLRGGPNRGSIVAFAERLLDPSGNHTGWIWPGGMSGEPQRLSLKAAGDFQITDAASLPDGSLLVLERSFAWLAGVGMRLRLVKAADLRPGRLIEGEGLIEANLTSEIDNMEGLAVHMGQKGEAVITLISDDNFNGFLQRTILLQFALPLTRSTAATR